MYTVLLTYGLNPLKGLKLMVRSPEQAAFKQLLQQFRGSNLTMGTLVPADRDRLNALQLLTKLKFFVALESDAPSQDQKALPGSTSVGLQVYQHQEGQTTYKAEVVRWKLGKTTRHRRYYW